MEDTRYLESKNFVEAYRAAVIADMTATGELEESVETLDEKPREEKEERCDYTRSTDGHTGRDFEGHYSNAWIDSGDGSWWIDENGNEHSH